MTGGVFISGDVRIYGIGGEINRGRGCLAFASAIEVGDSTKGDRMDVILNEVKNPRVRR